MRPSMLAELLHIIIIITTVIKAGLSKLKWESLFEEARLQKTLKLDYFMCCCKFWK